MNDIAAVRPLAEQVRAFLTPRPPPQRQVLALDGGDALRIATPEGEIARQRASTGPAVLLLDGWEAQASDLASFSRWAKRWDRCTR